ncbi:MAG: alpha/beta fold hydrolase [Rhodospirillales bacterium]|nr:alpha/beta fold hydrolase [Rhodospirillales bacterium]
MTLSHVRYGDSGSPIVILHGLFGSARNWAAVARALSAHHRVFTVDLPNHGESPWTPEMDYPAQAARVRALMDGLGLNEAAILGHSMGGKVAMTMALETPERVARLLVVDIAPVGVSAAKTPFSGFIAAMRSMDLSRITRRAEAEEALSAVVTNPAIRSFLVQNLTRGEDGVFFWRINLAGIEARLEDITGWPDFSRHAGYAGPALFIKGEKSDYVPSVLHAEIRRLFPRVEIKTIADAGHWPHAERPDAFLAAATPFLGDEK